jgi:hypothetical protein
LKQAQRATPWGISDANPLNVTADFPVRLSFSELLSAEHRNSHNSIEKMNTCCNLSRALVEFSWPFCTSQLSSRNDF